MLLDTRNKNIYSLGVGILVVFEILRHFLFKGDGTTMYCHDLHTIRCNLTQETKIYMGGDFNGFQDISSLPVSQGTGSLCIVMTYIPPDAT
jgi:hypothetical protein